MSIKEVKQENMRFLDLFAGIGGFRLGMEQAGHECVGYVEWDKYARKSYEAIHDTEGEWTASDIRSVTDNDLGFLRGQGIDIICGGFPCQAFSVAGKRGGFDDTRGTLFFEIARFAKQIKPRLLLLENVKGLLSHEQGNTFGTILNTLDELGYDTEWQVLNSRDFGVPQNRERVFIIGHLRGTGGREIFPITETNRDTGNEIKRLGHSKYFRRVLQTFDINGSCEALDTMQGGNRQPCVRVVGNTNPSGNRMNGQVYDSKGLAPTLTTNKGEGPRIKVNEEFRKVTPREAWRLQSFPDWAFDKAVEVNSNAQLYKQAGNSVTVNVIYEIAKRLGVDDE
jgi:DNA (cytosine-5)-methyltransferase 1